MATAYPSVLDELARACEQYRRRALSLDEFKAAVWKAASEIVAQEERELREHLQRADGELDMIQFTTNEPEIFNRSLEVVDHLEAVTRRWRSDSRRNGATGDRS
jgi:hypothetical protein